MEGFHFGVGIAGGAQDLLAVFAVFGVAGGGDFVFAGDGEGAVDGGEVAVGHGLEDSGGAGLGVVGGFLDGADDAEGEAGGVECLAPVGEGVLGEGGVEDHLELAGVGSAGVDVDEAGVGGEVGEADRGGEGGPLADFAGQREEEVSAVAGGVEAAEGALGLFARGAVGGGGSDEGGLDEEGVGPEAVGEEGGADFAAFSREVAAVEGGDDAGVEGHAGGVVAHAGDGAGGEGLGGGADLVHEAGAGPVGGEVEAGFAGFFAFLAVGGEGAVDEAGVFGREVAVADLEALADGEGEVGDEDVGCGDEAFEDFAALGCLEVDDEALLVPVVDQIGVVVGGVGQPGAGVGEAPGVAFAGGFDLDDVGAEVGQDGGGGGGGDVGGAVDHLESSKEGGAVGEGGVGGHGWFPR